MNLLQSSLIKISDISFNTGQIPDVPKNPRFIKNERYEKLKKSLQDNPEMLPARELLVYNYDGELIVIGGNMRLRAAKELGYKEIPCKILEDLTAEQIRAIVIKDNVSFGSDDFEQLANEWDSIELEEWGMELPEMTEELELEAEEDNYEIPETIQTDIVIGDLFEIGEHRLLCGNCTHSEFISKLMNGEYADTIITDPPYSSGGFQESGKTQESIGTRSGQSIALDNLSTTGYKALIREFIPLHPKVDSVYIFTDWKMWQHTLESVEMAGLRVRNMLVWDKQQMGMGMPWRNQHELICFGKKSAAKINSGKYGNVLQSKRTNNELHPTQKPIDIIEPLIKNTDCNLIFEPFAGSGTTMVAAHQNNKKCYATELNPQFCQVIIDRMLKLDPTLTIKRNGQIYNQNQ